MSLRVELIVVALLTLAVVGWAVLVASPPDQPRAELPIVQVGASPSPLP